MSSGNRQLVFCHQCENEWYREEHGLTCPDCNSDFTELVEETNDPRAEARLPPDVFEDNDDDPPLSVPEHEHPLRNHNPWADEERAGMGQFRFTQRGPGSFTWESGGNGQAGADGQARPVNLGQNFASMLQSIIGATTQARGMGGYTQAGAAGPFANGGTRVTVTSATFGGPGGATFRSQTLYPRNANGPQPGVPPIDDFHRMIGESMFGGDPHGLGQQGMPMNPLAQLFLPFLNPSAAAHGDAVFTQEALDRVISQLMEQNSMGNAPPPASQQDIASLPKVRITPEMQDAKSGSADCSICMDSVPVGDEVTRLYCGHWFHADCVGAWLREHDSCPQCRKGVTEARDEATGRPSSAPPSPTASRSSASGGFFALPSPSRRGRGGRQMSSGRRTSSVQNLFSGVSADGTPPPMPGTFGDEPTRRQSNLSRTSTGSQQRQQQQSQTQPQGFADRLRGLFGRGAGSG